MVGGGRLDVLSTIGTYSVYISYQGLMGWGWLLVSDWRDLGFKALCQHLRALR